MPVLAVPTPVSDFCSDSDTIVLPTTVRVTVRGGASFRIKARVRLRLGLKLSLRVRDRTRVRGRVRVRVKNSLYLGIEVGVG